MKYCRNESIDVFYCTISDVWGEVDDLLIKYVSPQRQLKIVKYKYQMDRKLSLYAALLTRMQLSKITGCAPMDIEFNIVKNHKPKVIGMENVDFSFGHTQGAILLSISLNGLVGVDIEKMSTRTLDFMEDILHVKEQEYINQNKNKAEAFLEVWTRKEAYMKQQGIGIVGDLKGCNTFSSKGVKNIYTWKQDDYICSVSTEEEKDKNIFILGEKEIQKYYLS